MPNIAEILGPDGEQNFKRSDYKLVFIWLSQLVGSEDIELVLYLGAEKQSLFYEPAQSDVPTLLMVCLGNKGSKSIRVIRDAPGGESVACQTAEFNGKKWRILSESNFPHLKLETIKIMYQGKPRRVNLGKLDLSNIFGSWG
jgi:hypothetical protein